MRVGQMLDLPQVDSLIFMVMARYIGRIKIAKGKNPRINRRNKYLNRAKDFTKV